MLTNHLLQAKYQIQKQLEIEGQHDLKIYVQNIQRRVRDAEKQYKVKFTYGIAEPSLKKEKRS